ncbi:MAG: short-chain fatty acid transporter [Brevinema sp.]
MQSISNFFSKIMQKYMPNAYIFALILTFIVFVCALFVTNPSGEVNNIINIVSYWGNGFWSLLAFTMQMALIVITGTALASTSVIKKLLDTIATKLNTPTKAIIGTAIFSVIACWFHYGFGLISSALLARKLASKIRKGLHYPLLVATAYSGFLVWHGGLSGSIPLVVAEGDTIVRKILGENASISLADTIFSPLNLMISGALLIILPIMAYLMMPKEENVLVLSDEIIAQINQEEQDPPKTKAITFAQKLENSVLLTVLTTFLGFSYIIHYLSNGSTLSINIVTFIFMMIGLALHKTPQNYLRAFQDGVKETSGILLQFPFYGGIMGIMTASGLGLVITEFFINISTIQTFPLYTFLVSGLVNFFVPSGGGQWAVQGHYVLNTAQQLNASIPKAILAISWGDAWTNMVQPFWALPLLSVAKLEVKDILGFTTPIFIVSGIVISIFFLFL